jgi:hypothetical protein
MVLLHFGMHGACVNGFALRPLFVLCSGRRRQKLTPTVLAAKVEGMAVALGM